MVEAFDFSGDGSRRRRELSAPIRNYGDVFGRGLPDMGQGVVAEPRQEGSEIPTGESPLERDVPTKNSVHVETVEREMLLEVGC